MSSSTRDHRIVRRITSLPRSIMGGISRSIGRRRNQHTNFQMQPQGEGLLPQLPHESLMVPEEWAFVDSFEQQYGTNHPFFYACRLMEAIKLAEQEHKFMFMYLHSPDYPYANVFCKETLCSDLVTQFLDVNFVCWGALADRGEGVQMVATLRPASFPCCAVIAPAQSDSIAVLQQLEGPVSPAELVEILQRTLEEQGLAFGIGSAKAKQGEKIRADRRLREEQDAAYLASLQIDKEKEKLNNLPSRERVQKPVEAHNTRNYVKPVNNSVNVSKQNNKVSGSASEKQDRGITRRGGSESQATQILIRFPNGERREHTFLSTDKVQSIFSYIDSLGLPGIGNYRLISNFPRKAYGVDQMRMTLKDTGLYPKASLFLEPL